MTAPADGRRADYIVACIREAGSMYPDDARQYLADHDAGRRAEVLDEAAERHAGAYRKIQEVLDYLAEKDAVKLSEDAGAMGFHIVAILDGPGPRADEVPIPAARRAQIRAEVLTEAVQLIEAARAADEAMYYDEPARINRRIGMRESMALLRREFEPAAEPSRRPRVRRSVLGKDTDGAQAPAGESTQPAPDPRSYPDRWLRCSRTHPTCPNAERARYAVERGWTQDGRAGAWLCTQHAPGGQPPATVEFSDGSVTLTRWDIVELAPDYYGLTFMQIGGWLPESWEPGAISLGTNHMVSADLPGVSAHAHNVNVQIEVKGYGGPQRYMKIRWRHAYDPAKDHRTGGDAG